MLFCNLDLLCSERLYALASEATARKADSLGVIPDRSLVPSPPALSAPNQHAKKTAVTAKPDTAKFSLNHNSAAPNSKPGSGGVTLEALRERAIQREVEAQQQAAKLKAQAALDEQDRLLQLLPALADAVRGMAVRHNRSQLVRKDCLDAAGAALRLTPKQLLQGLETLCAVVPEFLNLLPAQDKVPATVVVNRGAVYKEVRSHVVDYAHSQQAAGTGGGSTANKEC
jgi:hypothetical protein